MKRRATLRTKCTKEISPRDKILGQGICPHCEYYTKDSILECYPAVEVWVVEDIFSGPFWKFWKTEIKKIEKITPSLGGTNIKIDDALLEELSK